MTWRSVVTIILLAAAILSGWSAWMQKDDIEAPTQVETAQPDFLLRDFELVALDKQGKESFTLKSPELARNPNDKTLFLVTPFFQSPNKQGERWEMRAQTGWVSADNSEVRLRGNVIANSPPGAKQPADMKTEELDVFPEKNIATSKVAVSITGTGSTMTGVGMEADLDQNRIKLLSNVRSTYARTQR